MTRHIVTLAGALFLLAPSASAQQAPADGFRGAGAALCIAIGEIVAGQPDADADVAETVQAWRHILNVMEGTDERRQVAVDSARSSMARLQQGNPDVAARGVAAMWTAGCTDREAQVGYLTVHSSPERVRNNLAEEPGTPLPADAVQRLNVSAVCLAAAEMFAQRRPSRTLRAAFRAATPAHPDAGALQAIQERSRREIDEAPGTPVGKGLVVDYLRSIYASASGGRTPAGFVDRQSQLLHERCLPAS